MILSKQQLGLWPLISLARTRTFIYFACAILVEVGSYLHKRYGSARIQVSNVRLGVKILLRDITVISCFHPVGVVDYDLSCRRPARQLQVRVLLQIRHRITTYRRTYPALGLVLCCRIFQGEILVFGIFTTVGKGRSPVGSVVGQIVFGDVAVGGRAKPEVTVNYAGAVGPACNVEGLVV